MAKIGDRVGAIQKADNTSVYFYGYGTYQGKSIPPENVGGFNLGIPNPEIKLDSGVSVFGCECWWGPEDVVKSRIGDRKIIEVTPERQNAAKIKLDTPDQWW